MSKLSLLATVLVATLTVAPAAATPSAPTLDAVLSSVRRAHPGVAAAAAVVDRAHGTRLQADGAFDPRVRARGADVVTGYYDSLVADTELRATLPTFGIMPFVGWRLGRGAFPSYDDKQRTLDSGEVRIGLELPLLQGFAIDRARGERIKADHAITAAKAEQRQRLLDLERDAALAYWDWVAASHRLAVRRGQLGLALERATKLEQAVRLGTRPPIDVVDNGRLVASREAGLVAATQEVRRTAVALSLYLRDGAGRPIVLGDAAPPALAPPPVAWLEADLAAAIDRAASVAPRLDDLDARAEIAATDAEVARNARLPVLNVSAYAVRGLGPADATLPDRSDVAFGVGTYFEVPIGMRSARGAAAAAAAEQRRIGHERTLARDRVAAEVQAAHAELIAARQRADLASRGADLAQELADAERKRFERGDSNILLVNLREETAADAAALAVDARADVQRARVRFLTLLAAPLADERASAWSPRP